LEATCSDIANINTQQQQQQTKNLQKMNIELTLWSIANFVCDPFGRKRERERERHNEKKPGWKKSVENFQRLYDYTLDLFAFLEHLKTVL
jgi:hypothetical protein